jgi:predicted TIM-barrel fold metal-dependent hydrolase
MEQNEIERVILNGSKSLIYHPAEGNRELAEAIKHRPQLLGYVFFNPNYLDMAIADMERYLSLPNFAGVGELYSGSYIGTPFDCEGHRKLFEILEKKFPQKPVLCHCSANDIVKMARAYPKLKFILAHASFTESGEDVFWRALKDCPNVWVEPCSSGPTREKVENLVRSVGVERVLFGSDLMLLAPGVTIGMIEDAQISDEDKHNIFYSNAKALFQL